jgi:hypothetical protein
MRSLRYLNGRTLSPFPAEAEQADLNLAQFNRMVSQQIDALDKLLIAIKQVGV